MSLFVQVTAQAGQKQQLESPVVINMEFVRELLPLREGGTYLFFEDGTSIKVTDSFELFKQFVVQTVSASDIAKKVESLKPKASEAKVAIPKL